VPSHSTHLNGAIADRTRSVAAELVARTGNEKDPFWPDQAENLLTAGVAWLLADCEPRERTLGNLYDLLTDDDVPFRIAATLDYKKVRNRAAISGFTAFLNLPERDTRPSVLGTALMPLCLFDSDLVRHVTDRTSIDLAALVAGEPMTLYIIVPPARLIAFRPLLRTWLSGLMLALTQREALPKHRTLFLCDEIAQLSRLDAFLTASTLMRGYGMQLWTLWQNVAHHSRQRRGGAASRRAQPPHGGRIRAAHWRHRRGRHHGDAGGRAAPAPRGRAATLRAEDAVFRGGDVRRNV
jgi:type IV secretion system protein VirD4